MARATRTTTRRTRVLAFPYTELLFDARLQAVAEQPRAVRPPAERGAEAARDIVLDLDVLRAHDLGTPADPGEQTGEWVRGVYVPHRLRFTRAEWVRREGTLADLAVLGDPLALPRDADARRLFRVVHLADHEGERFILVMHDLGYLVLRAGGYALEEREGAHEPVELLRRWAPTPPPPAGLLPHRPALHARYAGDPITIRLGRRVYHHRLFIGGFHHQGAERPAVDSIINLAGHEHAWVHTAGRHPADRYAPKGEMAIGMSAADLLDEAAWVARELRAGRRVLVHCAAGINRSSTLCCATLMLLEGLSACEALGRVREHHPIADPDPYHWFVLQRLGGAAQPEPA